MEQVNKSLSSLTTIAPLYILPRDPFAEEVLIPGFENAEKVDCMAGFFSSEILASLAHGLATYINTTQNKFRLIISPLVRPEDRTAMEEGAKRAEEIAGRLLEELIITEDLIEQHTLRCLSFLISVGRIEIKVALMKNALFHPKVWFFHAGDNVVVAHGSSNLTQSGVFRNVEQIAIGKSWEDSTQNFITKKLCSEFKRLWDGKDDNCIVITMPQAIKNRLLKNYCSKVPPTETDLHEIYSRINGPVCEDPDPPEFQTCQGNSFAIPTGLQFNEGPFKHQGEAVNAWCESKYSGILEMATGSGKTITSMICAYRLYETHKPLLIVVAAPYIPLVEQWCEEIALFGLKPENLAVAGGPQARTEKLNKIRRRFRNEVSDVEVVVVSHKTLCSRPFKKEIEKFNCATLLIADEAHNLGSEGFVMDPPAFFNHRLGLSATPVRQYDEEGTDALFSFFGSTVFRFTLEEAIGHCLVEYDYYVHPVELTQAEMDEWYDLTAQIKSNSWRQENDKPDDYLTKLFRDRRALLENAENKIVVLKEVLEREDLSRLRHTLIYASDKVPEQLDRVNALLNTYGVLFHQLTYEETADRKKTAGIIRDFQGGTLRVLTAKRVLDEGVNIPQVEKAFVLASTTVERQWVQRRGRLLRTCKETNKTHSEIHDFVSLPGNLQDLDQESRTLIRSELYRVLEFARLARNAGKPNGPLDITQKLVEAVFY